jgi:ABC-2 type transport system permease protein
LLLLDVFILALWFAPVAAYQMLVSVSVPRAALVWAVLPPIALMLGQWILFGSWSIAELIGLRLGGVVSVLGDEGGRGVDHGLDVVNGLPLLTRPDLWIGVAVAAAMIFATIHIRRHRDDT